MQKKKLKEGISSIFYGNGALFLLLAVSVSSQPFILTFITVVSFALLSIAAFYVSKKFLKSQLLLISAALSGLIFAVVSRVFGYVKNDIYLILIAFSLVYIISEASYNFTRKINGYRAAGVFAGLCVSMFTVSLLTFFKRGLSAPAAILVVAAVIITYRFLWGYLD